MDPGPSAQGCPSRTAQPSQHALSAQGPGPNPHLITSPCPPATFQGSGACQPRQEPEVLGCGRPRCTRPSPGRTRGAGEGGMAGRGEARGRHAPERRRSGPARRPVCSLRFLPLLETGRRRQVQRERFFIFSPHRLESCPPLVPPRTARCPLLRGTVLAPGAFWAVEPRAPWEFVRHSTTGRRLGRVWCGPVSA